jgi:adenosylhomocysteine nucleosidase|tara:strand:- start:505 stop:1173 length:669 start_codon:yes stop_codon:yes gene_type:complete
MVESIKDQEIKIGTHTKIRKPLIKNGVWLATWKEETEGNQWFKHTGPGKINATYTTLLAVQAYTMVNNRIPAFVCHYSLATPINDLRGFHECTKVIQADMDHTLLEYESYETPEDTIDSILGNDRGITVATMDHVSAPGSQYVKQCIGNISADAFDTTAYAIAKMCKEMKIDFRCYKYLTNNRRNKNDKEAWLADCKEGAKMLRQMCEGRFGDVPPIGGKNE